jgi:hypothetical protein
MSSPSSVPVILTGYDEKKASVGLHLSIHIFEVRSFLAVMLHWPKFSFNVAKLIAKLDMTKGAQKIKLCETENA